MIWWQLLRMTWADIREGRLSDGKPVYRPRAWLVVVGGVMVWALIIWACRAWWPWRS